MTWTPPQRSEVAESINAAAEADRIARPERYRLGVEATDTIVERATAEHGVEGLGDPALWRPGLKQYLASAAADGRLNAVGIRNAQDAVIGKLRARSIFDKTLRKSPEVAEREVLPPIVIIGGWRTGTTFLYRLMARDPRLRAPRPVELYATEVRSRALRLLEAHGGEYTSLTAAAEAIAKQVGVGGETVRRWAVQAQIDAGARSGTTTKESAEIKRLKAENKQLREDVAILKAATTFFAGGTRPPQPMIVAFIDSMRANGFAVESICRVLRGQGCMIAAQTYRAWRARRPAARTVSDAHVVDAVRTVVWRTGDDGRRKMTPEGLYGRVKMRAHLHRTTLPGVSYGAVDRAMKVLGHNGIRRSKGVRTTVRSADGVRAEDLLNRQFSAAEPNRVWVTDFTYCRTWAGWVYVVFIIDVFSRRIVAWHASTSKSVELVTVPLRMALWQRNREGHPVKAAELIHHSDAGSQYTSVTPTERLRLEDIAASIGSVGDAYDNALAESVNGLYKTECIRTTIFHSGPYRTISDVEFATAGWVDWYNNSRLHSSIGQIPPTEFETLHYAGLGPEDQPTLEAEQNLG